MLPISRSTLWVVLFPRPARAQTTVPMSRPQLENTRRMPRQRRRTQQRPRPLTQPPIQCLQPVPIMQRLRQLALRQTMTIRVRTSRTNINLVVIPVTRRVNGYIRLVRKYVTGSRKRFWPYKVYIMLIRITSRVDLAMSVCPYERKATK